MLYRTFYVDQDTYERLDLSTLGDARSESAANTVNITLGNHKEILAKIGATSKDPRYVEMIRHNFFALVRYTFDAVASARVDHVIWKGQEVTDKRSRAIVKSIAEFALTNQRSINMDVKAFYSAVPVYNHTYVYKVSVGRAKGEFNHRYYTLVNGKVSNFTSVDEAVHHYKSTAGAALSKSTKPTQTSDKIIKSLETKRREDQLPKPLVVQAVGQPETKTWPGVAHKIAARPVCSFADVSKIISKYEEFFKTMHASLEAVEHQLDIAAQTRAKVFHQPMVQIGTGMLDELVSSVVEGNKKMSAELSALYAPRA